MERTVRTFTYLLVFLIAGSSLYSQPRKASVMVGSSFGLTGKKMDTGDEESALTEKKDELFSLGFTPRIGYHLSYHTLAGISVKYGRKLLEDNDGKMNLFSLGPFLKYYLLHRKIAPYIEVEAGTGNYNESALAAGSGKSKVVYYSGGGGIEFYFSPTFSFDMGVAYKTTTEHPVLATQAGEEIYNNLNFRAGISLHLIWKNEMKEKKRNR